MLIVEPPYRLWAESARPLQQESVRPPASRLNDLKIRIA